MVNDPKAGPPIYLSLEFGEVSGEVVLGLRHFTTRRRDANSATGLFVLRAPMIAPLTPTQTYLSGGSIARGSKGEPATLFYSKFSYGTGNFYHHFQ